jgi:hypothetical protein
MENRRERLILTPTGVLLMILVFTACSSPSMPPPIPEQPQSTETPQAIATEPATEPPTQTGEGLCTNAYYPVREGATWTYQSTGGPAGEYSFTDTITEVRDDGFTLSTEIAELTRTQEWSCSAEGLLALQFGGAPAAMLNSQNMQLNLDVINASGVTFPRDINPGDQWQQTADFAGNASAFNEEGEATGEAEMNFSAIGTESVTVPAGTFEALKIQVGTTLNAEVTYQGLTVPVTFSGDHTYWFAPGVGWVKATGTGSVLGTSFSETIELQSYNVP